MNLIISKIPPSRASMAYTGACFSNAFAIEPCLIKFIKQKVIYPVYKSSYIPPEKDLLHVSDIVRKHHNLTIDSKVYVELYIPPSNAYLRSIKFHIFAISKIASMSITNLHEKDVITQIKENLKTHYFSPNQICLLDVNNYKFTLVVTETVGEGIIYKSTKITVESSDDEINLISSKLLKHELFQDNYKFENIGIGGLEREMISIFREALCTRAYRPEIIEKLGIKHVKGILLYGPPGTGKTLIARNIGSMISPVEPVIINGPELLNKYVGASEENIRTIFLKAEQDHQINGLNSMLHVIIFDEIDAICKTRGGSSSTRNDVTDSMVNQLLTKIDGCKELPNIFIIAMTNRKDLIDPALLRKGRIGTHIKIAYPDKIGREEIFRIHTKKMKMNGMFSNDIDLTKCASLTDNFTGAEIKAVVEYASSLTLHKLLKTNKEQDINESDILVTMADMVDAIISIEESVNDSYYNIAKYLPNEFKMLNDKYATAYQTINAFIDYSDKNVRLKSLLLYGSNKSGKTTLMNYIAFNKRIKSTKYIKAIDVINKHDTERNDYLISIMRDAYIVEQSLLILDDIDIMINYAKFGHSVDYSRMLFQTLKTVLKTIPDNRNNRIIIVCICGEKYLKDMIGNMFNEIVSLNNELDDILAE